MKKITPPLLAYFIVSMLTVFFPASDGYNTVGWKFLVGQIYAIPVLIVVSLVTYFVSKRHSHR